MKLIFELGLISGLLLAIGCAHGNHPRGSVALKHSDSEADVCLGKNEVKAGDRVALYDHQCVSQGHGRQKRTSCAKLKIGEGEITQVLNDHYSTMKVSPDIQLKEGTMVEKL